MTSNPDPQSQDPTSQAESDGAEIVFDAGAAETSPQNDSSDAESGDNTSNAKPSSTPPALAVADQGPGDIAPALL